jgi:hypothetical protein
VEQVNVATIIPGEYAYQSGKGGKRKVGLERIGFDDLVLFPFIDQSVPTFIAIEIGEYKWNAYVLDPSEVPLELVHLDQKIAAEFRSEEAQKSHSQNCIQQGSLPLGKPTVAIILQSELNDASRFESKLQAILFDNFKFIERKELSAIWDEQKLGMTGLLDEQTVTEAGRIEGLAYLLFVKVSLGISGKNILESKVVSVENGEVLWFLFAEGNTAEIESCIASLR